MKIIIVGINYEYNIKQNAIKSELFSHMWIWQIKKVCNVHIFLRLFHCTRIATKLMSANCRLLCVHKQQFRPDANICKGHYVTHAFA